MLTFGSLFAGIGGIDLGFERAGMRCVWQVEIDDYCQRVLAKHWPHVRRWDDIRTFPPEPATDWRCDVIAGGFPCQDISNAGKRTGITGKRSGLWSEFSRVIRVLRPDYVLVENVAALLERGAGRVLGDLAALGFDAEWSVLSACAMGAPHTRERVFVFAYANKIGCGSWFPKSTNPTRFDHWKATEGKSEWEDVERWLRQTFQDSNGTAIESKIAGISDGFSEQLDQERECETYGNAVVPQVAEWIGRQIVNQELNRKG